MSALKPRIRFKAKLLRPAEPRGATWSFLLVPKAASVRFSSRGMVSVEGTINGVAFCTTLDPDGQGSHWMKVPRKLREAAGAAIGDSVALDMALAQQEPEPRVPPDLLQALAAVPAASAVWSDISRVARRDWIQWITSARRTDTRVRRIANTCEMLASGKRRVCCFDRSGIFSKGISAPQAAK